MYFPTLLLPRKNGGSSEAYNKIEYFIFSADVKKIFFSYIDILGPLVDTRAIALDQTTVKLSWRQRWRSDCGVMAIHLFIHYMVGICDDRVGCRTDDFGRGRVCVFVSSFSLLFLI